MPAPTVRVIESLIEKKIRYKQLAVAGFGLDVIIPLKRDD